jgi:hypothetical protein
LTEYAGLVHKSTSLSSDDSITRRVKLDSPEDFLERDPEAVEVLCDDLRRTASGIE